METKSDVAKTTAAADSGAASAALLEVAANESPPKLAALLKVVAPVAAVVLNITVAVWPFVYKFIVFCIFVYSWLPVDIIRMLIGLSFCFCGGLYPALFAAAEALRLTGWFVTEKALRDIVDEVKIILTENAKDNLVDDDNDNIPDVEQIDNKALLRRKAKLVLSKCDPQKINTAVGGLYTSWIGVLAVLKIQFARTIALALSIAEALYAPAHLLLGRSIYHALPKEYHKWVPVIIGWVCKLIGMSVAWFVQRLISAVASAARGGMMAADSLTEFACKRGLVSRGEWYHKNLPLVLGSFIAFTGLYMQLSFGFSVPWPLNWFLWPLGLAESYIQLRLF